MPPPRTGDEVVQFGSGRSPPGRWLPRAVLACLVLAAIVTAAVRAAGQQARHGEKAPLPPPPVRVIIAGHPLLGVTAGWELFARGPDDLLRIQLAQGKISVTHVPPLETASPDVAFVIGAREAVIHPSDLVPGYVVPDGGQARPLTGVFADGGPLIPGPAHSQAVWVSAGSPTSPEESLVTLTGRPAGPVIRFGPGGPQIPATAVSDGRGYVLVDTGSFSAYDAGPGWDRPVPGTVEAVGPASWLVLTCDARYRHCRNEVVGSAGAARVLPGSAPGYPYDFAWPPMGVIAPDGRTAAVVETGRDGRLTVHLISLRSGADRNLKISLGTNLGDIAVSSGISQNVTTQFGTGPSDQSMVWSPDGRWLFVAAAGGKLVAVDARTDRAEQLPAGLPPVTQVAIRA